MQDSLILIERILWLQRIYSSEASVGHSYNLIDINTRRILNVETASRNRYSVYEVGSVPFFHANMYLHLKVQQAGCISDKTEKLKASNTISSGRIIFILVLTLACEGTR